jgi:hypothetical protein
MQKSRLLALVFALNLLSVSAVKASIFLYEWGVNIDGAVSFPSLGDPVPSEVNVAGFDDMTGLGAISVTITGAGSHTFDAFFDHDIDESINTFFNETGAATGIVAAGQSWEIDEPGFVNGDIFENFQASVLDNGIGNSIYGNTIFPDDVSMAMGWDFTLAAGEQASIDILLGLSAPNSGFFLTHTDPDSNLSFYVSSTINISQVPIPAAVWLFGSGLLGLIGIAPFGVQSRVSIRADSGCPPSTEAK